MAQVVSSKGGPLSTTARTVTPAGLCILTGRLLLFADCADAFFARYGAPAIFVARPWPWRSVVAWATRQRALDIHSVRGRANETVTMSSVSTSRAAVSPIKVKRRAHIACSGYTSRPWQGVRFGHREIELGPMGPVTCSRRGLRWEGQGAKPVEALLIVPAVIHTGAP